jgi:uncharacterized damage-inducible protein DinB
MQTLAQYREFLGFNDWANGLILGSLSASKDPVEAAIRAFAHLLLAESVWLRRFRENLDSTGYNFWPDTDIAFCESLYLENKQKFAALFDSLTEESLETVATYKNSEGNQFSNTLREVLTHVFFHSGHHRGQILTYIRAGGETPPYVVFIGFMRRK